VRPARGLAAALCACALALALPARGELTARERRDDFDAMWSAIDSGYAYFDAGDAAWRRARQAWRSRAANARTRGEFVAALRGALEALRDDNVSIAGDGVRAARVPYDIDVWPRWESGGVRIEAVRVFSDADVAGMLPGQRMARIADLPAERAIRDRLGHRARDAAEAEWALRRLFAEREPRAARPPASPLLSAHRIGEERDLGYLRLRLGIPELRFEEKLDTALEQLGDTRGLIVDLRDNTGPASRELTRTVLARFARRETRWQLQSTANGKRMPDTIAPAGTGYAAPVAVLIDRWTAGEGEALAQGLKTVAGAQLIGTRTAGLRGATTEVRLPNSGLVVTYPSERTFDPAGRPRRELVPDVAIDLAAPKGGPGDPILYQALRRLQSSSAPARPAAPR